jgi:hypothetical protein
MTSQLFAFRLAKPMEMSDEDPVIGVYDPVSQTSTWTGGSPALAVGCTLTTSSATKCYAYGSYCNSTGGSVVNHRRCD